jgi:hypothetical protein
MRHWFELATYDRDGFTIIVDKSWEDTHPSDLFDDTVTDIKQLCEDIDRGVYDWFMLRARVLVDGLELGEHIVGGFCYEDARETLTDGTAEDLIQEAIYESRSRLTGLAQKFTMLAIKHA